ncbi:TetR/AcrR family transcriptional regulator [Sciscionella marina]|uniref:TetR/AcrR family transcriptional regulator n=1 Tax=Sciscionella marina TaxID=508770 RepID=UPI000A03FEDF|nr:TetR family transcriptional regulator [Sciscionella marina]
MTSDRFAFALFTVGKTIGGQRYVLEYGTIAPMATASASDRARAAHLGPDRRRPQVLDAALHIAAREGVGAISIGSVAKHLQVTRPVIYACFTDRIALIEALVQREQQTLVEGVMGALPKGSPRPTERVFISGVRALLQVVDANLDSWRVVFDSNPDPAVVETFGRARKLVAKQVERLLDAALRYWGTVETERKLPMLVEFFMAVCEGAVRAGTKTENNPDYEEIATYFGRSLYQALRTA